MTREAIIRTLVYAGLIAVSILLWWALINLWIDMGPLPFPNALR